MKKLINWFTGTRFYLQVFCGYEFKIAKSISMSRIEDVWQNDLMLNGWDVHVGVEVSTRSGFYAVFMRMPLLKEYGRAAKELGYDCTGDEFYLMGVRGEIDWTRKPEWVYFSETFREVFKIN